MASFLGVRVPFTADGTAFKRGLNTMRRDSESFAGSLKSMFKDAFSVAGGIGIASGISSLIGGVKSLGMQAIKGAADMEQLSIAFEVMLGSASKAKAMLAEMERYGATTPYELTDVVEAGRLLLNYQVAAERVMPTMKMLGDVAGGNAEKLNRLALAFGQANAAGYLKGQDRNQMVEAGFNPVTAYAEKTGRSVPELTDLMEAQGFTIEMVAEAFEYATSEGGQFFGMTERQGKTTLGLWSNLRDAWAKVLRTIGTPFNDWLKPWIEKAIKKLKELGDVLAEAFRQERAWELAVAAVEVIGAALKDTLINAVAAASEKILEMFIWVGKKAAGLSAALGEGTVKKLMDAVTDNVAIDFGRSDAAGAAKKRLAELAEELKANAPNPIADAFGANAAENAAAAAGEGAKAPKSTDAAAIAGAFSAAATGSATAAAAAKAAADAAKKETLTRPELEKLDVPSIIASDLATIGGGGRAASMGTFDPVVAELKLQTEHTRRMTEYLAKMAQQTPTYEPVG